MESVDKVYNINQQNSKLHYWVITLSVPHKDGYQNNKRLGIVAPDAVVAIDEVKKIYPECKIWSMANHGGVDNRYGGKDE